MTKSTAKMIMDEDKRIRKRWTDNQRTLRLKKNAIGSPPRDKAGCDSNLLHMMADVEVNRLREGHMFSTKDNFWMRIGEEAIRQNMSDLYVPTTAI
jgi:hypothetical protein